LSFPALLRVKWCQEFHIGTYCISYLHVLKIGFHGQYRIGAIYQNLARNILVWGEYVKQVLKCAIRQRISYPTCLCNMYMTYIYIEVDMIESPFYPHLIMFMAQSIPLSRLFQVWMLEYFPHTYPFCDLIFSQRFNNSQFERQNLHSLIALFH
jgi:hypothetical protein